MSFVDVPTEIRLLIYENYLEEHCAVRQQRQPSNDHLRLLSTCRFIYNEAHDLFHQYVSLTHERQIRAFVLNVGDERAACIRYADVANDDRVSQVSSTSSEPLSALYLALRKMTRLTNLRVFECRQGLHAPISQQNPKRYQLRSERSMYPSGCASKFRRYNLFLDGETRVQVFDVVHSDSVQELRLSGNCILPRRQTMTSLRHLTLYGVTGNYFDQNSFEDCFAGAHLESFCYAMVHRMGFEIRDRHLTSLSISTSGARLRKLVLLGCQRLTTAAITSCLFSLSALEYFALSIVTVDELSSNFISALPSTVTTFKFGVTNARYARPLVAEERSLCDTLELVYLLRHPRPSAAHIHFRAQLMTEGGRRERWKAIARGMGICLELGLWDDKEEI